MSDDLTRYLLSDRRQHAKISPEGLQQMAKQAAAAYLDKGVSLNASIVKIAGAQEDISPEQVKRIVEFANQEVYLGIHEKNKTAQAESSYPQFELADVSVVLRDLGAAASPERQAPKDTSYSFAVEKTASVKKDTSDRLLEDLFRPQHEPELEFTKEAAEAELVDTKHDLLALRDNLKHAGAELDNAYDSTTEEYYDRVKRHLLDGGSFSDILAAARTPGIGYDKIASALQPFVQRLIKEKVAHPKDLRASVDGFEKVAHRVVNEKHPLVTDFRAILALNEEIEKVSMGLDEVDSQLDKVASVIKERLGASSR